MSASEKAIETNQNNEEKPAPENVFKVVNHVSAQLEAIEQFVSRRFDEISMEINATSQQVDMAEDGIIKKFAEILEIISAISYSGDGKTAANSGVELEAVIEDTENAANTILDAADRIASYVSDDADWNNDQTRSDIRDKIKQDVQDILLACTFQDLTGQRIRNTLDNLHQIESRLSSTFERLGIDVKPNEEAVQAKITKASSQEEIDALIKGYEAAEKSQLKKPAEDTADS